MAITNKFGDKDSFLQKVNPNSQVSFAKNVKSAINGDYPTLIDICNVYGKTFAEQWLYPQIADLSMFTGARNLGKEQIKALASVISIEYRFLKVTELLLFFYRFKTGRYGRFYGSVDPMVITCALREFLQERNDLISKYDQEKAELDSEQKEPTLTYEQWLEVKKQNQT